MRWVGILAILLGLGLLAGAILDIQDQNNKNRENNNTVVDNQSTPIIHAHAVAKEIEVPEVVTPNNLIEFPKLYQDHRVTLVGWQSAMIESSNQVSSDIHLPANCKYLLNFIGMGASVGCISNIPPHLLTDLGAALEENINLICTPRKITPLGIFLTDCVMMASDQRKMQIQEHESKR